MGQIVIGMGSSHSPQLSTPSELWLNHGEGDKNNPALIDTQGVHRTFEELLEIAPSNIAQQLVPEKMAERHQANQQGIARLAEAYVNANLDALVIIGDDQEEMFRNDHRPAIAVYWGETFTNGAVHITPDMSEARKASAWGWREPDGEKSFPVAADMGLHLIEHLREQDFDIAHIKQVPDWHAQMGHAFAFVYRRIMQENVIPTIPIMVNTYYPPNQPTLNRCYQLGREIRAAVESWPADVRVGVIASGGLSHFVIDEDMDQQVMRALRQGDKDALVSLPRERMDSGTSEIRNWIAMAGASEGLSHQWSDYVPSYRTMAGTGCAMGFGIWS